MRGRKSTKSVTPQEAHSSFALPKLTQNHTGQVYDTAQVQGMHPLLGNCCTAAHCYDLSHFTCLSSTQKLKNTMKLSLRSHSIKRIDPSSSTECFCCFNIYEYLSICVDYAIKKKLIKIYLFFCCAVLASILPL